MSKATDDEFRFRRPQLYKQPNIGFMAGDEAFLRQMRIDAIRMLYEARVARQAYREAVVDYVKTRVVEAITPVLAQLPGSAFNAIVSQQIVFEMTESLDDGEPFTQQCRLSDVRVTYDLQVAIGVFVRLKRGFSKRADYVHLPAAINGVVISL